MPTKKTKKSEPVSVEFLIGTLASVQSALTSIAKESTAKTDALGALSENLNIMSEMLKNLHDQRIHDSEKVVEMSNQIKILQSQLENNDDVKEIKYSIQQLSKDLLELKTVEITKKKLNEPAVDKKKWKLFAFIQDVLGGLNHLKSILIIVLLIIILITSIFFGPDAVSVMMDIVKKMIS